MKDPKSDSGCPDSDTLRQFLIKNLSGIKQKQMAAHLANCAFCKEAVEGLKIWLLKEGSLPPDAELPKTIRDLLE